MKKVSSLDAIKQFFRTVFHVCADLRFFREVRNRSVADAIGYIATLLILTWVIPFSVSYFVGVRTMNDALISGLRENVALETRFTLKDDIFETNLEEPIVLRNNGFVFIVNSATSSLALGEDEIGIAINRDALVQREGVDEVNVIDYSDFPEFELDRTGVDNWIATFGPWMILLISIIIIFGFALVTALGFGVFVSLHALAFRFAMKMMKQALTFAEAFVLVAYAATVPILMRAIADITGAKLGIVPTLLYWMLLGFVIYDFKKMRRNGREMSEK